MTNTELINELRQQSCKVNAMKAKIAYRTIANELLLQIPEAKILKTKPIDLLEANIPDDPERLAKYDRTDMFFYHFVASMPDGRALRIRIDSSLERFRIYRMYWLNVPRVEEHAQGYIREAHVAYDYMVCNRSNSTISKAIAKLAAREPKENASALSAQQLQEYLNDQYN